MDRKAFYAYLRQRNSGVFGTSLGQGQVDKVEAVLDGIEQRGLQLNQAAYILATAYHESDRFRTLEEYASGAAYEGRRDLGNTVAGDGKRFKGRGLVQITGRRNYLDWSKRLNVDLIAKPERASELRHAVPILIDGMMLGTFTGRKLPGYVSGTVKDYPNARRVVNGMDKAGTIRNYALAFEAALKNASYSPADAPFPPPPDIEPSEPETRPTGLLSAILAILAKIFGKG